MIVETGEAHSVGDVGCVIGALPDRRRSLTDSGLKSRSSLILMDWVLFLSEAIRARPWKDPPLMTSLCG